MSLLSVESEGHDGCAELEEKTEVAKADISHRSMESEGGDDDEREVAKQEKNAKSNRAAAECRVLVRQPGGSRSISLNLDELRACHELRLELPFEDLAVGLPPGFSDMQVNTVAGDSPLVDVCITWNRRRPREDEGEDQSMGSSGGALLRLPSSQQIASSLARESESDNKSVGNNDCRS